MALLQVHRVEASALVDQLNLVESCNGRPNLAEISLFQLQRGALEVGVGSHPVVLLGPLAEITPRVEAFQRRPAHLEPLQEVSSPLSG